jgi:hypothetical protein
MTKTTTHVEEETNSQGANTPTHDEINAQLQLILTSPVFHGSKRCQQFLEYVCKKSLSGEPGALKERSIAIEVFGRRPEAAGHGEDTIVRVGAREVRKRLAQYYVTADGSASPIVIDLAPGAYVPEFRYSAMRGPTGIVAVRVEAAGPAEPAAPEAAAAKPVPVTPARRQWRGAVVGLCLVVMIVAGFTLARRPSADTREADFQRFWAPVLQDSEPLLIGVGHPIVYLPSRRISVLNALREPQTPWPVQRKIDLPPKEIDGSDMVPAMNQFVGFGDMVAANEVSQMLARRSRHVRLLMASSIPFADLRRSQAFLIGSFSNQWTVELSHNWRFQFRWTTDHYPVFVDTQANPARQWSISSEDDGSTPDDYSLICRVRNSPTGGLLIVSAGIKQFGTEAAGQLLADPAELGPILNKLPRGWEDKNLQIILHMKVIGNTPAQPELVAWHVW